MSEPSVSLGARATGFMRDTDIEEARLTLRRAQNALAALGYTLGDHGDPTEGIDGVWGKLTQAAVMQFQSDHGLPRTGQLDGSTQEALFDSEADAIELEAQFNMDEEDGRHEAQQILRASADASVSELLDGFDPNDIMMSKMF